MRKYPIPKRLGASLICFALILSLLPAGALAADVDVPEEGAQTCNCENRCAGTSASDTEGGGADDEQNPPEVVDEAEDRGFTYYADNPSEILTSPAAWTITGNFSYTVTGGSGKSIIKDPFSMADLTLSGNITATGDISSTNSLLYITSGNIDVGGTISSNNGITISGGHVKAGSISLNTNIVDTLKLNITGGIVEAGNIQVYNTNGNGGTDITVSGNTVVFADTITEQGANVTTFDRGVVFTGNTGTVYGDVTLPDDVTIPEGYTLTIPDDASLTVPAGVTLTVDGTLVVDDGATLTNNGTISGTGQVTVNGNVDGDGTLNGPTVTKKAQDTSPAAPSGSSITSATRVTLVPVTGSDGVGGIEYGYTTGAETAPGHWQRETTFDNLSPGTDYTFYARYAGNDYYAPSPASSGFTVTTLPDITTASLDAGYVGVSYSATLHASADNGKAVTWALAPGSTLPGGLMLNSGGTITGIPTAAATNHSFTVQATINGEDDTKVINTATLSITINAGTPVITAIPYNGETPTSSFNYGDTITIRGTINPSGTQSEASNGINSIAEPAQNQVGLYVAGNDSPIATAMVTDDSFTLEYDTAGKGVPIGENQTLTVRYGGSSTLTSGSATVEITLNKKSVTAQVQGEITKTYDGNTDMEVSLTFADGVLVGSDSLTGTVSGAFDSADAGTDKDITLDGGTVEWSDTATAAFYNISLPADVTGEITKATPTLTLTATPESLRGGGTVTLTLTGVPEGGNATVTCDNNIPVTAGSNGTWTATLPNATKTYTFTAACAESDNYEAATATCTVDVTQYLPPSNPNYRITVEATQGGAVAVNPTAAKAGTPVTLTPDPDAGYQVGSVAVTDRFGQPVAVTEQADGTYTFVMPDGQVTVSVTFAEAVLNLPFPDVAEGDWFYDAVVYAYENGLMDGVGGNRFAPNSETTRAQLVTILYRLAGQPEPGGDSGFSDVETGTWYTDAVAWAAENGIVNGVSDTEFAPGDDITREQLAVILYRYAAYQGYDVSQRADLSGFADAASISDYAQAALSWASAQGLVLGFEDDSLRPQGTASRAQIAAVLMRFCETVAE